MRETIRATIAGAVALACLLLGASDVVAADKTFTWTAPTTYDDGTPLDAVDEFVIYCGGVAGGPYTERGRVPGDMTSRVLTFTNGEHYCVATAVADGLESTFSNEVFFTVETPPSPPSDLTVSDN